MNNQTMKRIRAAIDAARTKQMAQGVTEEYKILTAACSTFRLTDIGNAERMMARFGDRLRYVKETKCWAAYDGKRWDITAGDLIVKECAQETIRCMYYEAGFADTKETAAEILQHADKSAKASNTKGMIEQAQAQMTASLFDFDREEHLLNTASGIVDLRTGKISAHSPEAMITKIIDIEFDPGATAPNWEQFIDDIACGDREIGEFLQRALGYSTYASQEEQVAFFITGNESNAKANGSNGKSLFLEIAKAIFGEYAATTDRRLIARERNGDADPKTRAPLIGARLAAGSEFKRGDVIETHGFKGLTGDEEVKAKLLYRDEVDFMNTAALWFATNYVPLIADDDDGAWRRMLVIPFLAKFYEARSCPSGGKVKDTKLKKKLQAELPGILAWIVRGAVEYAQSGLQVPERLYAQRDGRRSDSDQLHDWMEICLEEDGDAVASATDLYHCYKRFCEMNASDPMTATAFGLKLKERGIEKDEEASRRGRRTMRRGARLTDAGKSYRHGSAPAAVQVVADNDTSMAAAWD